MNLSEPWTVVSKRRPRRPPPPHGTSDARHGKAPQPGKNMSACEGEASTSEPGGPKSNAVLPESHLDSPEDFRGGRALPGWESTRRMAEFRSRRNPGNRRSGKRSMRLTGLSIFTEKERLLASLLQSRVKLLNSTFCKYFLEQLDTIHVNVRIQRGMDPSTSRASSSENSQEAILDMKVTEGITKSEETTCQESGNALPIGTTESSLTGALEALDENAEIKLTDMFWDLKNDGLQSQAEHEEWKQDAQIVVYGVGSLLDSEVARCQLMLACILANAMQAQDGVWVYDPVLTPLEHSALRAIGCKAIAANEEARRRVSCPTVFFMPHCEHHLYDNVVNANMTSGTLALMAVLGNSFNIYQERWSSYPPPRGQRPESLLGVHVDEFPVDDCSFFLPSAFNDMSWHFFPHQPSNTQTL